MSSLQNTSDISLQDNLATISAEFVAARRAGKSVQAFPGIVPESMAQAYQVQAMSLAAWAQSPGETPAGWKIGGVPPHLLESLGTTRLVGPAFPSGIKAATPGSVIEMPIFEGGFAAAESEFMFRIGADIPPGQVSTRDALLHHIAALHVGIEIASSPIAAINEIGPLCVVSDFGNNNGLAVGPMIPGWQSIPLGDLGVRTSIDGKAVGKATAGAVVGGPIAALEFLVAHCAHYGITLSEGTYVTTGAVTGVHQISVGQQACADFGQWGKVEIKAVAAAPLDTVS